MIYVDDDDDNTDFFTPSTCVWGKYTYYAFPSLAFDCAFVPQSKQRKTTMEDKYGGCMREMESLINQFRAQIISKDKDPNENSPNIKDTCRDNTFCLLHNVIRWEGTLHVCKKYIHMCVCVYMCICVHVHVWVSG